MRSFRKSWGPVIVWALIIFSFSTDQFSFSNTTRIVGPLVRWILPNASLELQQSIHAFVRKLGHWSEYFIFSLLLLRAFRGEERNEWKGRWALSTLILVLFYALSDELHQLFVPSRGAHFEDSMLDFFGGTCAVLWKYLSRNRKPGTRSTEHEKN
jgi:VanZ family protein